MFTLGQITTSIINELDQQDNLELYERVKDRVIALKSKLVRQSVERNDFSDLLIQYFDVPLKKVKLDDCEILVSDCDVEPSVDIKSSAPFAFVGTANVNKPIPLTYVRYYETSLFKLLPGRNKVVFYSFNNKKVYVHNNLKLSKIRIGHIFDNVADAAHFCSTTGCTDNDLVPIPNHYVHDIITILVEEFAHFPNDENNAVDVEERHTAVQGNTK